MSAASGLTAAPASASPAPIKIVLVTSLTGPGAAQFKYGPQAFFARIALQNAKGGVNGHTIKGVVVDDQTVSAPVAVQQALAQGAFGIVAESPLFFTAAKYPRQQGVPVTGGSVDGPEWGKQPYTNMFDSDTGSVDPKYPASTADGIFFRQHGGTVLGSYGFGISPTSSGGAINGATSMRRAGGTVGVLDTTVPIGSVDFTADAIVARQNHVDTLFGNMGNEPNFALATAYQQAGVDPKVVLFPTGYEQDVIGSTAWHSLQGAYFQTFFRPYSLPNAGTTAMAAAMQKYAHWGKHQFPNLSQYEAWLGADLMLRGLGMAGKNPTRSTVIKDLRGIKSYDGSGLLPVPINYSTVFGHSVTPNCYWYLKARESGFVPVSTKAQCGTYIPGTSGVSST